MTRFQVDLIGHRGDCWQLDTEAEGIQEIKRQYPDAILARDYEFRGSTARGDTIEHRLFWRNAKYAGLDDQAIGKIVRFSGRGWQAVKQF